MSAVAIVCSRQSSSRLPGKVFRKIAGVPALEILLRRITGTGIPVVVAVPNGEHATYAEKLSAYAVDVVGGNPDSPLHRMADIVTQMSPRPKYVIRITHDDILIDYQTMNALLLECESEGAGYGVTPDIVDGAGVEVILTENLLAAADRRKEPTEFVSYFVRGEGLPNPKIVKMAPRDEVCRGYRLTMDYREDANLLDTILRSVGVGASVDRICEYMDDRPWLLSMNRQPILSVYTCAKNGGRWIGEAVKSVLNHGTPVDEYVFVDDGSTDDTISEFMRNSEGDNRAKLVINETNLGLASSSNRALSACRGKYVMRLDADDVMMEYTSEIIRLIEMLKAGKHVVYAPFYEIAEDGRFLGTPVDPTLYHHVGGAIFDKKFLDELRFKEGLRNWDGLELHERMKKAGAEIGYGDSPTWQYRQHPASMSKTNLSERAKTRSEIMEGK